MASSGGVSFAVGAFLLMASDDLTTYSAYRKLTSLKDGEEANSSDVETFDSFCTAQGSYTGSFLDAEASQVDSCSSALQSAATKDALLSTAFMAAGASLLTVTFAF